LIVGHIVTRFRQDEMANLVWLVGLIWVLIISLWILDMPTGPSACFQCDATEKLTRTFFSLPMPSGLIDNDGPFLGTWPAAALVGYAIGARLALPPAPLIDLLWRVVELRWSKALRRRCPRGVAATRRP
jgi:hypothetical protein